MGKHVIERTNQSDDDTQEHVESLKVPQASSNLMKTSFKNGERGGSISR